MKRLSLNEIKSDIKNGYGYMEYEYNYYGENLIIINEASQSNVLVHYERNGFQTTYSIKYDDFLKMSRLEFNKLFNENLYYNMVEIEV